MYSIGRAGRQDGILVEISFLNHKELALMSIYFRLATIAFAVSFLVTVPSARAQQEFPPPQGMGRLIVLASGLSGPKQYTEVASEIAKLGYDVVLFDGNGEENTQGKGVKRDIDKARSMPHAQ